MLEPEYEPGELEGSLREAGVKLEEGPWGENVAGQREEFQPEKIR